MTLKEVRDHKFKILFEYNFLNNDIESVILNYFENEPYFEEEDDENAYIGNAKSHKNINKVVIKESGIELSLSSDDQVNGIKIKILDIVKKLDEIDKIIKESLNTWDMNRVGKAELTIIRLAVYEMYFDDSIDLKVAINEAVELAKVYGDDKADKFVNGVLSTIYKSRV